MSKKSAEYTCADNDNFSNILHENFKKPRLRSIIRKKQKNKKQCYEIIDLANDTEINDVSWMNDQQILLTDVTGLKPKENKSSLKICLRKVPNILKNNCKIYSTGKRISPSTNAGSPCEFNGDNTGGLCDSTATAGGPCADKNSKQERASIQKENKRSKRKQEYTSESVRKEFPNWNLHSSPTESARTSKISSNGASDSEELKNPTGKSKNKGKRRSETKHDASVTCPCEEAEQECLFSSVRVASTDVQETMDSVADSQLSTFLHENKQRDFHDSIDFTSNDIFNQFNYEFCNVSYLYDCGIDCDESYGSKNAAINVETFKEFDANGNDIKTCKASQCFIPRHGRGGQNNLTCKSSVTNGFYKKDVMFLRCPEYEHAFSPDLQSDYSFLNGSHCNESLIDVSQCSEKFVDVFHCIGDDETQYDLPGNCTSSNGSVHDLPGDLFQEILNVDDVNDVSAVEPCLLESSDKKSEVPSLIDDTDYENPLSIDRFPCTIDCDNLERRASRENVSNSVSSDEEKDFTGFEETYDPLTLNLNISIDRKELEDMTVTNNNSSESFSGFQCLSCPLKFSKARTMALHQAGAHGGTYIFLCDRCGRLFNRKYEYNRHFVHCGRIKEPFECDLCRKRYMHRSSLNQHLKGSHHVQYMRSCQKTFTCSVCSKEYVKLGAFTNHVKRHAMNLGIKEMPCYR